MEFIIVTGQSGAGKSHAIHCLEDLGYYAIDNMPPRLIRELIGLLQNALCGIDKVAFVADIRGGAFFDDLKESLDYLENEGIEYKVMFLEASDRALIRRYKETRRAHPLSADGLIQEGIAKERDRLAAIRERATFVIDTTNLKAAALNQEIKRLLLSDQETESFSLSIQSFGFKNGIPTEADWVLDVRFLPNPFYLSSMKKLTGRSKRVSEYVLKAPEAELFTQSVTELMLQLIPGYIREGKYHLMVAIGCTGGRHRSVAIAERIANLLEEQGKNAAVSHRDL